LAVEDNGPGFTRKDASGIGTRNVQQRLAGMYRHRARLSLANIKPHGARQELFIPIDDISAFFEAPAPVLEAANL
jgi:LytS/YehU family sensor histidine kinase